MSDRRGLPSPYPMAAAFFAIVACLSVLWALASPIFSIPDENAHATKAIAQVRGQIIGYHKDGVRHIVVDLPPSYSYNQNILCYATHPEVTADCHSELGDPGGTDWFGTWVGTYNPLYYYVVGWPSLLFDGTAGIYAMRIVSALVGSAFLAMAFGLAMARSSRRWLSLGIAFVATPMTMYLMGSVNPNGLEIASAVALWVGLLRLFERSGEDAVPRRLAGTWAVVAASAIVLANVRALGPLWLVLVIAVVAFASGWAATKRVFTTPSSYWGIGAVAIGGLFSIGWTQFGGSLSGQAIAGDAPLVGSSFLAGAAYMVRGTPDFLHQALGYFGWFDTLLPTWAYWLPVAATAILLALAVTVVRRRNVLVMLVALAVALVVPVLVQGYSVHQTGIIWQGRYFLFFYLGVAILAAWVLASADGDRVAYLAPRITWIGACLIAAYGLLAFFWVLMRYIIGTENPVSVMWKDPHWQPPLTWPVLVALYLLASIALVVLVGLAGRRTEALPGALPAEAAEAPTRDRQEA